MDFDPVNKPKTFELALFPPSIREQTRNYSTLSSYIYIISKEFNPFSDNPKKSLNQKQNLVKIGFSNIKARDGSEKGLSRLLGFRTSLISFKVHRLYLYETDQQASNKNKEDVFKAHKAEQKLHEMVSNVFKPKTYRITFSSGNESEWFAIPKTHMEKFLKFCDEAIYNRIHPNVLTSTEFTKTTFKEQNVKRQPQIVGVTRVDKNGGTPSVNRPGGRGRSPLVKAKSNPRNIEHEYGMSLRQMRNMDAQLERQAKKRKEDKENRKKLAKTVPFWKDVFLPKGQGLTFYDKKMFASDNGLYPRKIITDVFYNRQILVAYEPNIRATVKKKLSERAMNEASGYLTINEMLDYFPQLKQKHKASYDFYKRMNKYEDDIEYANLKAR